MFWTRVKLGVLTGPPKESIEPNPASSIRITSTLGHLRVPWHPG